ncbi:MAG TPA: MaoC family dehydratase [Mycobacteriales bacterium]|nr:MaoC family dehydratase [Mycobacteriales bacterium]
MTDPADYHVRARNIDPLSDNKIHDDEVARRFGFRGALVPGVELFAYLTHPLVEVWGADFLRRGRIDVRFRRPVYDGEDVVARARAGAGGDGDVALTLSGADGVVRSTGSAWERAERPVDLDRFGPTPLPETVPPASADALPPGPLGSVHEQVDEVTARRYLDDIAETCAFYADDGVVHPGALLRMVNAVLVRNVVLGPWIHTASRCVFLDLAPVPSALQADAVVTGTFERNGHRYVQYDALVRSGDTPVLHVEHTAIYEVAAG